MPTLDSLLADLAFTVPVTVDDCSQVRDMLREHFPAASIEVYSHKGDEVTVRVDGLRRVLTATA